MFLVCADLEGVFVPEIWIQMAEKTGIPELRLTTRDIADYDVLMRKRLGILDQHGLKLADIQAVIATMEPLAGALAFLDWLRARTQVIILSDTFVEFAAPLMAKLRWPTLFCHSLEIAPDGAIAGYRLRQANSKQQAVVSLKKLNFDVLAMGDSYNDIAMLKAADSGILFRPPETVRSAYPQFAVAGDYPAVKALIEARMS